MWAASALPEGHWRGLQRTIPASVQTDQGPSGGGSNCVPQSAKPARRVVPGPLANLEPGGAVASDSPFGRPQ